MRCLEVWLWVVLMATAAPAYAGPNEPAARAEYEKGTAAYNLGQFDEAALHYQAAYNWDRDPNMLFNTAQSFQLGGRYEQALGFFRSYMREAPAEAPQRRLAEQAIEDLKRKLEATPTPATMPAAPVIAPVPEPAAQAQPLFTPAPQPWAAPAAEASSTPPGLVVQPQQPDQASEPSPFYKTWWFWTAAGAAVVAGTVTAFLLTRRTSDGCDGVGMDCVRVK